MASEELDYAPQRKPAKPEDTTKRDSGQSIEKNGNLTDGPGTASFLDLESMRSLSKQRLPVPSKLVEALIEYVEKAQKEARDTALEEAAQVCFKESDALRGRSQSLYLTETGRRDAKRQSSVVEHAGFQIRDLKSKGA